jgi:four helix bundle protein
MATLKAIIHRRTFNFSLAIIKLVSSFPKNNAYLVIVDQLLRAATSIGAHLVEAKIHAQKENLIVAVSLLTLEGKR